MAKITFDGAINKFRLMHMAVAEAIDVWRVVPRTFIMLYGSMLWWIVKWFTQSTTIEKVECKEDLVLELVKLGKDPAWIEHVACTITDAIVVAPPTAVHATFASVVAGLSTAVFALYSNAGKDWSAGVKIWSVNNRATKKAVPTRE